MSKKSSFTNHGKILYVSIIVQLLVAPVVYSGADQSGNANATQRIAFRIDDIQDFWMSDLQVSLLQFFIDNEIPATLGVIHHHVGKDAKLTQVVHKGVENSLFELALHDHGFDYGLQEYSEQIKRIEYGAADIEEVFGVRPVTFIPPMNRFTKDTIRACSSAGLRYLSSSVDMDPSPHERTLVHYPSNVEAARLSATGYFVPLPGGALFQDLIEALSRYGFAVVEIHPVQFSVIENGNATGSLDRNAFEEFKKLVRWLADYFAVVQLRQLDDSYYVDLQIEIDPTVKLTEHVFVRINYIDNNESMRGVRRCPARLRVPRGVHVTVAVESTSLGGGVFVFDRWMGDLSSATPESSLFMDVSKKVQASWKQRGPFERLQIVMFTSVP